MDDFFLRALVAGLGIAIVAGPLGCFVVWQRMSYFGATMSHSALLGVATGFLLDISLIVGVFIVATITVPALLMFERRTNLPSDTMLGILAHGTLALGLVLLSYMSWLRIDLMGYLFGDILAVSASDIFSIFAGAATVLAILVYIWRPLLAGTVNMDLAEAEGLKPRQARFVLMLLIAAIIALAMKIVGILLIVSLLIIPAATARHMSANPEQMAVVAALLGSLATITGLFGSLEFDTPSGPSIVLASLAFFLVSLLPLKRPFDRLKFTQGNN